MAKINIDGKEFTLNPEKVQELMQWLNSNGAVSLESAGSPEFEGKQLLNETQGANVGNPSAQIANQVEPDKTKGANVGSPKPQPGTNYEFGGTWF